MYCGKSLRIENAISEEKRLFLGRQFSVNEVEYVVNSLKREKAPGPDGI